MRRLTSQFTVCHQSCFEGGVQNFRNFTNSSFRAGESRLSRLSVFLLDTMEWAANILSLVVKEAALAGRPDEMDRDDVCTALILAVQVSRQFERHTLQLATAQQLAEAATEFLRTGQTSIGQCQHVRDAVVRFRQLASANVPQSSFDYLDRQRWCGLIYDNGLDPLACLIWHPRLATDSGCRSGACTSQSGFHHARSCLKPQFGRQQACLHHSQSRLRLQSVRRSTQRQHGPSSKVQQDLQVSDTLRSPLA